eukprot:TRINITY_DN1798_c0_g1_i1.p1 TRINITY_DN1798_c0_g1~~TRINITY_DN1798_c0_g1_i1.p1  ORF type:complete len:131 (+),score=25.76 TRINITY_DN1798_c0_g1_i1:457-849(+)
MHQQRGRMVHRISAERLGRRRSSASLSSQGSARSSSTDPEIRDPIENLRVKLHELQRDGAKYKAQRDEYVAQLQKERQERHLLYERLLKGEAEIQEVIRSIKADPLVVESLAALASETQHSRSRSISASH